MSRPSLAPAVRPIRTADGSVTLERIDTGWTYRSIHGADTEARAIFVDATLLSPWIDPKRPRILEFGFGAGINFAATLALIDEDPRFGGCSYCAIDGVPVRPEDLPPRRGDAHELAATALREGSVRTDTVDLRIHPTSFLDAPLEAEFDAIYFDPFGPTQQPLSWSVDVFSVAFAHAAPLARLATYSAAGWVRRNMARAGFFVATVPGPPGKREFTLAARRPEALTPFRIRNAPG